MKTAVTSKTNFMARPVVPYPNVVSRRQFCHKLLDTLLVAASGMGVAVMLVVVLIL